MSIAALPKRSSMEKRSSIKDSGLHALFRATETVRAADEARPLAPEGTPDLRSSSVEQGDSAAADETTAAGSAVPEGESERTTDVSRMDDGRRSLIQPSRAFPAVIRVVGVGGAGTNVVNRMLQAGLEGVEFIAINTDVQALSMCEADHKLRIGRELTKGLGGGSDPQIGRDAAMAAHDDIKVMLKGSDMVFITAGEGGGTGTGAAPVVAEIAKSLGALTIGVVSRPFAFEGKRRGIQAIEGIRTLRARADTVIVVPNDKLLEVADRGTSMIAALRLADDVLRQGVQGICDLVTVPGLINLDLADVRTIMTSAGTAHMGIGRAHGEQRAQKAADMAVNSSLLETSIEGARGILLNISGGTDLSLHEVNEVAEVINAAADPEANIIFGAVVDERLGDAMMVTVVATGFDATSEEMLAKQLDSPARLDRSVERKEPLPSPEVSPAQPSAPVRPVPSETSTGGRVTDAPVSPPPDDDLEVPSFLR
jgi:cell division protein FtsZ